ncbi:heterokaryon incompatibility protein-domain-containing protein [Mariannaea sp. PMI_226]|nr:heterokaryon incompatibility protein-domain-containing protein [Mariannaea sp. PMI_226]
MLHQLRHRIVPRHHHRSSINTSIEHGAKESIVLHETDFCLPRQTAINNPSLFFRFFDLQHYGDMADDGDTGVEVDLSIGDPDPQGYVCWDGSKCQLCSTLQDRQKILKLYIDKFIHLGTTMDLLQWSQQGTRCMLCVYIIVQFIQELGGPENFITDASLVLRWEFAQEASVPHSRIDEFVFEMSWGFPHMRARQVRMPVFTTDNEPAAQCVGLRPPNSDVTSDQTFETARKWIETCEHEHTSCGAKGPAPLPRRVLEISGTDIEKVVVRLLETNGEDDRYAALSYVWGDPKHQCTTINENLAAHKASIPLNKLPNTVLDAIFCAHRLGLKYLWVDALCIVQDSLEDKQREISKMGQVYKNAWVTISAAMASGASEGFTDPRVQLEGIAGTCFELDMAIPKDVNGLLTWIDEHKKKGDWSSLAYAEQVRELFRETTWCTDPDAWESVESVIWLAGKPASGDVALVTAPNLEDEPISKRGWTLQESWLSRRLLIFGSGQVLWHCAAGDQADGGQVPTHSRFPRQLQLSSPPTGADKIAFRTFWRNLLHDFAHRQLGDPADKLNALQGIVNELEHQIEDKYLAGLWTKEPILGLSWYQNAMNKGFDLIRYNESRVCPSWSWAKVDGPLSFSVAEIVTATVDTVDVTKNEVTGHYPESSKLVVEGQVVIRGPVSQLPILDILPNFKWLGPNHSPQAFTNHLYLDGGLTNPYFTTVLVDGEEIVSCPQGLKFMELSRGKQDGRQNLASESRGLILVAVDGKPDTYHRVGFFIVALEYDVDAVASGENMLFCLSVEDGNVQPTEFGEMWTESLKEETVTIV